MARIKKDKTSWHAGGVIHRDNRHDKSVDGTVGFSKKKNTKKWCKGIVGRVHQLIWQESKYTRKISRNQPVMEVACENCGKVFETDWGFFGRPKKGKDIMLEEWRRKLNK